MVDGKSRVLETRWLLIMHAMRITNYSGDTIPRSDARALMDGPCDKHPATSSMAALVDKGVFCHLKARSKHPIAR